MTVDENKISFIICVNDDMFFEECVRYIYSLTVPEDMMVEVLEIRDAASMAAGYNEGMAESSAKYKVYMHQDVFLINKYFIYDILSIFKKNAGIGMIGMVGSIKTPENGIMWSAKRVGFGGKQVPWEEYRYKPEDGIWDVECVDGLLMATQIDIPWRADLFDGWDYYDVSQSYEMRKNGYQVAVPVQNHPWYLHDDKLILSLLDYNKYRKIFCREYLSQ